MYGGCSQPKCCNLNRKRFSSRTQLQIRLTVKKTAPILLFLMIFAACKESGDTKTTTQKNTAKPIPVIKYELLARFPHDSSLFTEGLLVHQGQLFESTGSPEELANTESMIGVSSVETGKFEQKIKLDRSVYFGEGICILKNKIYQLTYQNQEVFVYHFPSFALAEKYKYSNKEGWGLTTDGTLLIMSDGTSQLSFIDPEGFRLVRSLPITANGFAQNYLNELEFIKGYIYANIWMTNLIVKIDPKTGFIVGQIDMSPIVAEERKRKVNIDVMNGIAYDSAKNKVYVTGKLWTSIYEISFPHE